MSEKDLRGLFLNPSCIFSFKEWDPKEMECTVCTLQFNTTYPECLLMIQVIL